MASNQEPKEELKCTFADCQELQTEDGEFCAKHYPSPKRLTIELQYKDLDSESVSVVLEVVARLIREGFTSGYYPTWSLEDVEERDYGVCNHCGAKLDKDGMCTAPLSSAD